MAGIAVTPERLSSRCRCQPDPSPIDCLLPVACCLLPVVANANWFYYFDSDPFSEATPIEKPDDCDCDKPGTLTDTLIGPLESFFGKEAQDDEIIGAESLPTTPQGWGCEMAPWMVPRWRREKSR